MCGCNKAAFISFTCVKNCITSIWAASVRCGAQSVKTLRLGCQCRGLPLGERDTAQSQGLLGCTMTAMASCSRVTQAVAMTAVPQTARAQTVQLCRQLAHERYQYAVAAVLWREDSGGRKCCCRRLQCCHVLCPRTPAAVKRSAAAAAVANCTAAAPAIVAAG